MVGLFSERAASNSQVCKYLRELLARWESVEKEWAKLLPVMTNCPAVKHQSNVFFEFTSVDNSLKKLIKQVGDMSSLRKLADDHKDQKYMRIL